MPATDSVVNLYTYKGNNWSTVVPPSDNTARPSLYSLTESRTEPISPFKFFQELGYSREGTNFLVFET